MPTINGGSSKDEIAREVARIGEVTQRLRAVSDRDVLLAGRRARIAENKANGERWQCFVEFYRRRLATEQRKKDASPHFALTARQETVVEIGSLWGLDAARVRKELNVALYLCMYGEPIWQMCLDGKVDGHRATLIADAAREKLDDPADVTRFMTRMLKFIRKHLKGVEGCPDEDRLVTCTVLQLRNKIDYEIRLLDPAREDDCFRKAFEARKAYPVDTEPGMGRLAIENRIDKVKLAHHRLTLAARRKREDGDDRTVEQIKTDLALDLLIGEGESAALPKYARPIVNLTVPIQTVMGIADAPGVLSGGTVVPASLARLIAADPDSTWHRMLVDDAGRMVELSTKSYQPTKPIWAQVVAEHASCFRPGCDSPSTEGDLDHREAWPIGATDTTNLWPGCRTDHRTKHAPGFGIEQDDDGSYVLCTAAGMRHRIEPTVHPVSNDWRFPELPEEEHFQFSATELTQAIEDLRLWKDLKGDRKPEQFWEYGFDEALTDSEWDAIYNRRAS